MQGKSGINANAFMSILTKQRQKNPSKNECVYQPVCLCSYKGVKAFEIY